MRKQIKSEAIELANLMQQRLLQQGYIVHRYNAFSTNSIYLKIDYGVGGSIRLADHNGKKHLNYRFNLLLDKAEPGVRIEQGNVCDRHYYNLGSLETLLTDVYNFREGRLHKYGGFKRYISVVKKAKDERNFKGFWSKAHEIRKNQTNLVKDWLSKNQIKFNKMKKIIEDVRETNPKLDTLLLENRNEWEKFPINYLDLILVRYKELTNF